MADGIVRIPLTSFFGQDVNAMLIDSLQYAIGRGFAERHIRIINWAAFRNSLAELRRLTNRPSRRDRAASGELFGVR